LEAKNSHLNFIFSAHDLSKIFLEACLSAVFNAILVGKFAFAFQSCSIVGFCKEAIICIQHALHNIAKSDNNQSNSFFISEFIIIQISSIINIL
jgi:hypothetical protein